MSIEDMLSSQAFLQKGGRCGKLIRLMDWRKTSLHDPDEWPQELRAVTNICLHSNIPMIVWWSERLIMLYNDAALRLIGSKHPDAMGAEAGDMLAGFHDAIRTVLETGEASSGNDELLLLTQHGRTEETYFSYYHCAIHNDSGKPQGVLTTLLERTALVLERRLAETLLLLNKILFLAHSTAEAYEHIPKVFRESQFDFPFVFIYEIAGNTAVLKGSSCDDVSSDVAPDKIDLSKPDSIWPLKRTLDSDDFVIFENSKDLRKNLPGGKWQTPAEQTLLFRIRYDRPKRADIILIFGITPYQVLNNTLITFFHLFLEQITDRLAIIEREVENMQVAHEQSTQAAEQLEHLRHISNHELQEPLRKIRTFTNLVQDSIKNEPQVSKHLAKIDDAAAQMSSLIQNLTKYSGLSLDTEALESVNLTESLETAIKSLREEIERKKAIIKYNPLPEIRGARQQLTLLFTNLLENSLRFSAVAPIIVVNFHKISLKRNETSRNYLELIYTDNGIGFDQRHANKAFLIFNKLHDKKFPGNGVGLTLCKKIVENHHGSIEISSKVNQGTVFRILLPLDYNKDPNVSGY
jgi:signal transduction histidine kinase